MWGGTPHQPSVHYPPVWRPNPGAAPLPPPPTLLHVHCRNGGGHTDTTRILDGHHRQPWPVPSVYTLTDTCKEQQLGETCKEPMMVLNPGEGGAMRKGCQPLGGYHKKNPWLLTWPARKRDLARKFAISQITRAVCSGNNEWPFHLNMTRQFPTWS